MNRSILKFHCVLLIAFAIFLCASTSSAQRRESRGKRLSKAQVEKIVDRVEERVDNFVKHYDKSLDKSKLDGTEREDWLLRRARDLERATDELRREFDRRDSWADNKAEVRSCLNIASDIDKNITNNKYSKDTEAIWAKVRFELNSIADIYELPKVGSRSY